MLICVFRCVELKMLNKYAYKVGLHLWSQVQRKTSKMYPKYMSIETKL